VLVEVVEHDLGHRTLFEVEHERMPLRFDSSRMSEMPSRRFSLTSCGDLLLKQTLVDLIGDLGDHDALAVVLHLLHMDLGADGDGAATRL
jgi:hypothetical protein